MSEGAVKTNEHNSVLYWLIIERHKHVCKPSSIAISEERRKTELKQHIEIDSQRNANKSTTVIIMITSKGAEISC